MYFLPACEQAHVLCSWGQPSLYTEAKTQGLLSHMNNSPAFQEVICPWASGTYRLKAFLFYRSLKHSNLNLKYNISYHRSAEGTTESLLLMARSQLVSLHSPGPLALKMYCELYWQLSGLSDPTSDNKQGSPLQMVHRPVWSKWIPHLRF